MCHIMWNFIVNHLNNERYYTQLLECTKMYSSQIFISITFLRWGTNFRFLLSCIGNGRILVTTIKQPPYQQIELKKKINK